MIPYEKISPNIGIVIRDFDIKKDLNSNNAHEVLNLLLEFEVVQFKKQSIMSPKEYLEKATLIYEPMNHPFISSDDPVVHGISPFQPYDGLPEITGIYHNRENKGNLNEWHSDLNWLAHPSFGSILRCQKMVPCGGDTVFASMTAAYKDLSDQDKKDLEGVSVIHDFTRIYSGIFGEDKESLAKAQKAYPMQKFPLVLKHPLANKYSLFANKVSTSKIDEVSEEKSQSILNKVYELAKRPEYQARLSWKEGDIALWDNISVHHYAVSGYWPHERKMERISFKGIDIERI